MSIPTVLLSSLLLTACVAGAEVPVGPSEAPPQDVPAPATAEASATRAPDDTPRPEPSPELAVFRDPAFRTRFAESYLAETEIEPRVTADERDTLQKAMELMAQGKSEDALKLLDGERGEKASAVVDFTVANIHFQSERYAPAADAYEQAVAKYPKFRRAWKNLGFARMRLVDAKSTVRALTRVIELGGQDAATFGVLGFAYAGTDDHLAAESAYRMAALLDPSSLDWKMGLAQSLFKQVRFGEAVSLLDTLLATRRERADLWLLQANAYLGLKEPMKAAENYELVDRLGGATLESLSLLGDIYVSQEMFDLAANAYVRALERDPERGVERTLRAAKVLGSRRATDETRVLLDRLDAVAGVRLTPAIRKETLKLRARLAMETGGGAEEARVLQEVVALDPLDGDALILLGQHSGRGGDLEQAIFYFERAAGLAAFEADAKLRHGQLLVGARRYAEAMPLLRRALALKPSDNVQTYLEQVERAAQGR